MSLEQRRRTMKNGKGENSGVDEEDLKDTGEFDRFGDPSEDITKRSNPFRERLANIGVELQTLGSRALDASRSVAGITGLTQADIARDIVRFGDKSIAAIKEYMLSLNEFTKE